MGRNLFARGLPLILILLSYQHVEGQDLHPTQGQPQGGDRRGAYLNDPDESDEIYEKSRQINRLYPDPKIYLHTLLSG